MSEKIFLFILVMLSIFLGVCISQIYDEIDFNFETNDEAVNKDSVTEAEILETCNDMNVTETAYCIRNEVKVFYNYSVTDEAYSDIPTLKEKGGDCYNYAKMYERLAEKLGFGSTTNRYSGVEEIDLPGHRWALMWGDTHYCMLDLLSIKCNEIGG